jgi:hypothetical protein
LLTIVIGAPRRGDEPSINLGSLLVPYPVFSRFPGMAVGAAGAWTVGENGLGPPGSMRGAFSVGSAGASGAPGAGVAGGAVVSVVVVVVVVVVGDWVVDARSNRYRYNWPSMPPTQPEPPRLPRRAPGEQDQGFPL